MAITNPIKLAGIGNKTLHVQRTVHVIIHRILIYYNKTVEILISNTYKQSMVNFYRWETVANFITQHIPESKRSAKETLAKAKDMQKMGRS